MNSVTTGVTSQAVASYLLSRLEDVCPVGGRVYGSGCVGSYQFLRFLDCAGMVLHHNGVRSDGSSVLGVDRLTIRARIKPLFLRRIHRVRCSFADRMLSLEDDTRSSRPLRLPSSSDSLVSGGGMMLDPAGLSGFRHLASRVAP
jgi:hypothetical protein